MGSSTEQRELDLVEKVDFRILNVANNESKLNQLLGTYLAPLLLKAASEHASVRAKVVTIAQRLHTFIQPPGIVLPVATLLDQYKAASSPVLRQLDIMFIQHSIGRLAATERGSLIAKVLKGIGANPTHTTAALFNVLFRILKDLKVPPRGGQEDTAFRKELGLVDSKDAGFVADWFGKLLLLRLSSTPAKSPGLGDSDVEFLTLGKPDTWNPSSPDGLSLPETRIRVATVLASGAFTDEERFMPAVYAAANTDYRISTVGDDLLKRSTVSLEDESRVKTLFKAHSRLPAAYRIRILNLLSKSAASTGFTDEILQVVQRDINGSSTAPEVSTESTSSKGLELTKIHKALFEYINWVARMGPGKGEFEIGPALIDFLRGYVESQGWPNPERQSLDETTLRSRAYETVGVLAKGCKMAQSQRLSLVGWLFRSLSEDPTPDVVVNIDGALSSLTPLFGPTEDNALLRTIILTYMTHPADGSIVRSARHAATKWANLCLKFSDPMARWVDILAVAGRHDERNEVIEEGRKGLDPWTYRVNDDIVATIHPDWKEMVQTFFKEPMALMTSSNWHGTQDMDVDGVSVFTNFGGDVLQAFPVAVTYCKRMLFLAALKDFKVEPGWERQLETLVLSDKQSRETVRSYLKAVDSTAVLDILTASFEGILLENLVIAEECARSFVEIASLSPKNTIGSLASRALELLPRLKSNKKEIRNLAAKAFGILAAHPSNTADFLARAKRLLKEAADPWKTAVGSDLNAAQGSFLAIGHLLSRLEYYRPQSTVKGISEVDLEECLPAVADLVSAPASFQDVISEALAQLWTASLKPYSADVLSIIDALSSQGKRGNERAITALGRLGLALGSGGGDDKQRPDVLEIVLSKLYGLYEIRQAEVHFSVGEAITSAIACWDSDVVRLALDVESDGDWYRTGKRSETIIEAMKKILADCKSTRPSLLKASGIWLFCIIQHCSHLPEIQSRLRECQVAFMRLLSARDDLVQETASRGLALVYEKGDPSLKEALVKDLVGAFTGSGTQLKVEDETELFEAGALPTGEGKSITSYKDIVNLANEVGDQSLVYRFMSLASNAATWSTRSAFGRFGLSSILSESEVDPKLFPKLYRYRFDPNSNVQRSMNDIWKALVKDSNAVLEAHFDPIITDLLKSIHGKEWRVRQASCAAIEDLVAGRPFQQYEKYYKDIWTKALRVLDDVKGTVREAALHLCMSLSNTLTRQLEEGGVSAPAKAMMNEALPFLLSDRGIDSGVQDVKAFATLTVLKVTKTGGKALRPFIATIVSHLLDLLSTIEPEAINYYYQRLGEDNREVIDKMRSQMVSQSPIYEGIENCLRHVDSTVMPDLASGLEAAIKSAIGMPTKIGCSRVLGTLATRHTTHFAPFTAQFLQLMEKQALDRNDEVSQSYARAAAYVIRFAPAEAKERFTEKYTNLYFASEDEVRRQKVADVVLSLSKISPDHFNSLETRLLPFSFLGSHDTDDYVKKAFEEVWSTHAGSGLTVTRYVPEIVALIQRSLDAAQWPLKHAGALTAAAGVVAVTGASDLTGHVNVTNLKALWPVLDKSLALKTFAGKEKLLDALPDFVSKGKPFWQEDKAVAGQLKKIAIREAKRNNDTYRFRAFQCLWEVAAAREDLDMLDEITDIVSPYLDELKEEDRMDVDKKEGKEDLIHKTASKALEAVARGYSRPRMRTEAFEVLSKILQTLKTYLLSAQFGAIRREVWYKCVQDLMDEAAKAESTPGKDQDPAVALGYFGTLDAEKPDLGTEPQRAKRAKAIISLAKALQKGVFGPGEKADGAAAEMKGVISKALTMERALDVQKLLRDALVNI